MHVRCRRWQDRLYTDSCLAHKPIDTLMLDTTYALPKHTFPPQEEAVNMMVQVSMPLQQPARQVLKKLIACSNQPHLMIFSLIVL